ncbi:MAG: Glycine/D-amino acid oxidase [Verrucomicrobiaceae bacterium]|nr:Glycine/D-amino acid oxidase [Verrucomicrobiaceae bacterium]
MLPHLIIGQGLAGTAVAWHLRARGVPFLVVDRDEAVTSSKVAAGLLTPITGMRLTLNEDYLGRLAEAVPFYRHKERLLGRHFLHARPVVRLFKNGEEPRRWAGRMLDPAERQFTQLHPPQPLLDERVFDASLGGFQMKHAGYLDTAAYLAASRALFEKEGCWQSADMDVNELSVTTDEVKWQGRAFREVIFCQGWEAARHPWFDWVPFAPARGTILTARAGLQGERRIINRSCWVVAREDGLLRIGSTYELKFRDPHTADPAKLAELHQQIQQLIKVPVEILDQQTAVRPAITRQRTLIGRHPAKPRVAFLNGLGSKGTLLSPHFARRLVEHLLDGVPVPAEIDVAGNL